MNAKREGQAEHHHRAQAEHEVPAKGPRQAGQDHRCQTKPVPKGELELVEEDSRCRMSWVPKREADDQQSEELREKWDGHRRTEGQEARRGQPWGNTASISDAVVHEGERRISDSE